ncbi:MAG: prepilin-type N-terminal cleavage/methylation domain-containing protein [Synergistaceae bacterium]|nr:prepilin-type N-terminal cleavage/methylation domain-containing protein [Synergistaceae bacterium]
MFSENGRRGLTLVETLIAVVLCAVVGAAVLQATRHALLLTVRFSHRTLAWERGQNVLSILKPRVLNASLGVTWERTGDKFQRSFGANWTPSPPPAKWTCGPVQVWQGYPSLMSPVPETDGVCRGRGLALLYAVPSSLKAKIDGNGPVSMDEGASCRIELVPPENRSELTEMLYYGRKNDLWSWVVFPFMRLPVYTRDYSGGKLTVQLAADSALNATLLPYDEMHYLRSDRFQVQNETLYSETLRQSWTSIQPRVDGVLELWFELRPSKRLLDVWVLAAGGPATFGKSVRPQGWPDEAPWRSVFERYDLAVARASWPVKNL